jgi:hypothetical protein
MAALPAPLHAQELKMGQTTCVLPLFMPPPFILYIQQVRFAILDEADQMLDMGFEEDMETILGQIPKERQVSAVVIVESWSSSSSNMLI